MSNMNNEWRPDLRLVKPGQQEEHSLSPEILEQAAKYYTPEQLAQMVARREQLKQRWSMKQVSEATSPPVEVRRSLPTFPPTPQPTPVLPTKKVEPLPLKTDVTICPTCKLPIRDDAYGFVSDSRAFKRAEPCPTCSPRVKTMKAAKQLEREVGDLFGGTNIPDYASTWDFSTYPANGDQVAMDEALAFANKETYQRGLYLWGDLGYGKTSLAVSILKTFLARGDSGLYVRAPEYLRLVNLVTRGNEKNIAILDLAYSVTCLVLDDLGVEQATPPAIRQFYELVEERRGTNGLYTIITSNLSIDSLEERWRPAGIARGSFHEGMRVTDRLRESWGALEIQGISIRAANYESEEGQ